MHRQKLFSVFPAIPLAVLIFLAAVNAHAEKWVRVKHVADGDTVILQDGTLVRYIGLDAPEIDHKTNRAEPYGYQARDFNKKLVWNTNLRLEYDRDRKDRFGRKLAYVFNEEGLFVNQALVAQGYAFNLYSPPNLKYQKRLMKTQQKAILHKKGMWKDLNDLPGRYVGNSRSKRFHLSTCPYGSRTRAKNKIYFTSLREVFLQGYAPCRRCLETGDLYDP